MKSERSQLEYNALPIEEVLDVEKKAGNSIFKDAFVGVPENFVSVYRFVNARDIKEIGENGIGIRTNREWASRRVELLDSTFDKFAPPGYSRSGAILAHPDALSHYFQGDAPIKLELKIDPETALVSDGEFVTSFVSMSSVGKYPSEEYAKSYWETAITLRAYQSLNPKQRDEMFHLPEVIIPVPVKPELIRFVGANPQMKDR